MFTIKELEIVKDLVEQEIDELEQSRQTKTSKKLWTNLKLLWRRLKN